MGLWWVLGQWLRASPAFSLSNSHESSSQQAEIQKRLDAKQPFSVDLSAEGLCKGLPYPVFHLSPEAAKFLDLTSKCKCATYIRSGSELHRSQFTGQPHQYYRWVFGATSPIIEARSELEIHSLMLNQNPDRYLDSTVIAYIPSENHMQLYEEIAVTALTEDQTAAILMSEGKKHMRFIAVRDIELAERLQLLPKDYLGETQEDLVMYRYFNPESLYLPFTVEDYRAPEQIHHQTEGYLRHHFSYPPALRQLRLKLMRQKYLLHRSPTSPDYSLIRKEYQPYLSRHIPQLAAEIIRVKPLIRPLTCVKDMQMLLFPLLIEIMKTKRPILVLSCKEGDLSKEIKRLNMRQVAKKYLGKVITVAAKPSFLAHSHIKHIQLRHKADTELRLYLFSDAEYPTVSRQYRFPLLSNTTDTAISAWVQACLDGKEQPYWENDELKPEEELLSSGNYADVAASQEAWVYVGRRPADYIARLPHLYRLPIGVELPYKRLAEGLYRVREGEWQQFPA